MDEKLIHAVYDDDDVLLSAVKELRNAKYQIKDVFTPFPCLLYTSDAADEE